MARPRKPIAILETQGTSRPGRHAERAVEPRTGEAIVCPAWLAGEALTLWESVTPQLAAMGVLDGIDQSQLAGLCVAWGNWRQEQAKYEAGEGHIYKVTCAWNSFSKIASQFGMDPVSRTKLATSADKTDDPFDEWLTNKRDSLN